MACLQFNAKHYRWPYVFWFSTLNANYHQHMSGLHHRHSMLECLCLHFWLHLNICTSLIEKHTLTRMGRSWSLLTWIYKHALKLEYLDHTQINGGFYQDLSTQAFLLSDALRKTVGRAQWIRWSLDPIRTLWSCCCQSNKQCDPLQPHCLGGTPIPEVIRM